MGKYKKHHGSRHQQSTSVSLPKEPYEHFHAVMKCQFWPGGVFTFIRMLGYWNTNVSYNSRNQISMLFGLWFFFFLSMIKKLQIWGILPEKNCMKKSVEVCVQFKMSNLVFHVGTWSTMSSQKWTVVPCMAWCPFNNFIWVTTWYPVSVLLDGTSAKSWTNCKLANLGGNRW